MTELTLTFCFFLFTMAAIGATLMVFRWRTQSRPIDLPPAIDQLPESGLKSSIKQSMLFIAELTPARRGKARTLREQLAAAGYRGETVVKVFHGAQVAIAVVGAIVCGWAGLLARDSLGVATLLAICGAGFFFILPDRFLFGSDVQPGDVPPAAADLKAPGGVLGTVFRAAPDAPAARQQVMHSAVDKGLLGENFKRLIETQRFQDCSR